MTCIVGVQHEGQVWIGGDSAATAGSTITPYAMPKVFLRNGYLLGYAGSFRAGQILQHNIQLPAAPPCRGRRLDHFIITQVIPTIRDAYIDHGIGEPGPTPMPGWPVMLGVNGALYAMDFDWAAHRSRNGYMAIGSGDDHALGSLHTSRGSDWHPAHRVRMALAAAAHHSTTVCRPFKVITA